MADANESEFLVIGAGLPRTATMSLKVALEILLPGKCHHMIDAMPNAEKWRDIITGKMSDEQLKHFFLSKNFVAAVDAPFCFIYKRAMKIFPNAKVILSTRDPERWVESVQSTVGRVFDVDPILGKFRSLGLFPGYLSPHPMGTMMLENLRIGEDFIELHKAVDGEDGVQYFTAWNANVEQHVPEERLLKFQARDGWAPLCKFLGVSVPDVPYPNMNTTVHFQGRLYLYRRRAWLLLYELVSIPLLTLGLCYLSRR